MINRLTGPKIRRRWWVHPIPKHRKQSGCFTLLFEDLLNLGYKINALINRP